MDLAKRIETFHDENRYFIPLVFVAFILMVTGMFFRGPLIINYDVNINRTLLFNNDAVIQAVTLRPGWTFNFNVISSKPVTLSLFNLAGDVVATSNTSSLRYSSEFLDLYFVRVSGTNYAILDFSYSKSGNEPYPTPFLFFGSGLILLLGVIVYYVLEPWSIKMKRHLSRIDSVFYPLVFLLASVIFWIFRDSLIWFIPKSWTTIITLMIVLLGISFMSIVFYIKRLSDFFKSVFGYVIAYFLLFLIMVFDYSVFGSYVVLLQFLVLILLIIISYFARNTTALVIYSLNWLTGLVIKVLTYSIGVPVVFDTFLTVPASSGTLLLLAALEGFMALAVYFFIRAYYARNKAQAIAYGLYASVLVQAFLQVFTGTSLI